MPIHPQEKEDCWMRFVHTLSAEKLSGIKNQYCVKLVNTSIFMTFKKAAAELMLPREKWGLLMKLRSCSTALEGSQTMMWYIYIWQIISPKTGTSPLYKVGVTSERLGTTRIRDCAKSAGFCYNIIAIQKVDDARSVEKRILSLGEHVNVGSFGGYTEVVSLSANQLSAALEIIKSERGSEKHANGVSENVEI